ncbi:hypothetical protein Phum_PHUM145860 [Pediculus humanus corporis]|uniref:Uncharacterized protein n=1 Tax=Pediculus humanus subsp. corporis TaxID=121224 RepID=E0VF42_PEDHC|nr:uncharacterized protein Phum_PHUM145860 [Pediculus humanus corporis]EEB11931.1 hypothetical protein Phum_PHUM145860 [Pediculus humanus corporis]
MNSACVVVLSLALFAAITEAYVGPAYPGIGFGGVYGGATYGTGCPTSVCDTCNCVKTVVRPVVEQIPYSTSRRVQSPRFATTGVYAAPGLYPAGAAALETRAAAAAAALETRTGFLNGYAGYGGNLVV